MFLNKLIHKLRVEFRKSDLWKKLPKWLTKERGFFGNSWHKAHQNQIEARTLPPTFGAYLIDVIYRHKFGLPLFIVLAASASLFHIANELIAAKYFSAFLADSRTKGTFLLAIISAPAIIYTWFIRAHERTLSIQKEEDELWSKELNGLINQAVDDDNATALRLVAIRQMQDYLSGAKWKANQAANSSAILEAFSSIIDQLEEKQQTQEFTLTNEPSETKGKITSKLLDVIGSVMRGALHTQGDKRVLQVIGNNMSELNLSHLNLNHIDFSELNLAFSKFEYSNLEYATLNSANLNDAQLNYADLWRAQLNYAKLWRAQLNYAELWRAKLNNADLWRTELNNAKLRRAQLNDAELNYAELNGAELNGAELNGAKLNNAKLNGAKLNNAKLNRAELNRAQLNDAQLNDAQLNDAQLNDAQLNDAQLNDAQLYDAQLNYAELIGAKLNNANLNGANLIHARDLTKQQLTKAINWEFAFRDEKLACGKPIPTLEED